MNIKKHVKIGNAKIGKDTAIFNMTSATNCPSRKLGLCQLKNCNHCYALLAEKRFPNVLAYRKRQETIWDKYGVELRQALDKLSQKHNLKYVRFNESGDFKTQLDVDKLAIMAHLLPHLTFYGYTARKDLSYANRPSNLVINGSGWRRGKMNQFNAVLEYTGKNAKCKGDCSICDLCKVDKGIIIENRMHGSVFNLKKEK